MKHPSITNHSQPCVEKENFNFSLIDIIKYQFITGFSVYEKLTEKKYGKKSIDLFIVWHSCFPFLLFNIKIIKNLSNTYDFFLCSSLYCKYHRMNIQNIVFSVDFNIQMFQIFATISLN
jgi:hypothetical protein